MGAFLNAIGGATAGAGAAAGRYGEQIRGLLEQRRGDFATMISHAADQESDPATRAALYGHVSDLLSGKPIGQIAQKFSQTLTKRQQDNDALAQTIGPPPQAPQPQPGPAQPGQMPGTPQAPQQTAAQPSTSPVQAVAQVGNEPTMPDLGQTPIPPISPQAIAANAPPMTESLGMPAGIQIPGLPVPQDPQAILRHAMQNPLWAAPANRPLLLQAAQQELSHNEALRQTLETKQFDIAFARNAIQQLKAQGIWDNIPEFYQAELTMVASGAKAPAFPFAAIKPVNEINVTAEGVEKQYPGWLASQGLTNLDPNMPLRLRVDPLSGRPVNAYPASVPTQTKQFAEGVFNFNPRTGKYEPVSGVTPISMVPHEGVMSVQQADGSIRLVPVETGKKMITSGQGIATPNSVHNAQPDVQKALEGIAVPAIPPVGGAQPSKYPAPGPAQGPPPISAASARQGPRGVLGPGTTVGGRNLPPQQILQFKNSFEVGAHQLWGDPDNPALVPLASYANLADDPGARDRISKALKLVLESGGTEGASHIGTSVGPVSFSAGGIGEWITNELGVPQALAQQRAEIIRGVMDQMKPEELAYFNSLMNAIPTITGLRRLTGGSAFKWSQTALERELPMVGLAGTTNANAYRQKMIALGDEVLTGAHNLARTNPEAVDPRLTELIKQGGMPGNKGPIKPVGGGTGLNATHQMNGRGIAVDPKTNKWVFVDDGKPVQ